MSQGKGRQESSIYKELVEKTSDCVWKIDTSGVLVFVTPPAEALLGYSVEEITGKTPFHFMEPGEARKIKKYFRNALAEKRSFCLLEYTLIHKGGHPVYLEGSGVPYYDEAGELGGYLGACRDITQQKRAEEALRDSEEKYRSLVRQSMDMLFLHDLEGNFLEFNEEAILQTGYPARQLMEMNVFDLHPDKSDREDIMSQWKRWPVGYSLNVESRHRRKDGTIYPVEITTGKVLISGEEQILALARDISSRKEAEGALRESHEMLERTQRIAQVGSWEWDIQGDQVRWSPEFFRITGLDPQGGAPSFARQAGIFTLHSYKKLYKAVEQCVSDGTPYELELTFTRADGSICHGIARGQAEYDGSGEIHRLVGSFQDITQRKQAEREIADHARELEELYRQLDQELDKAWQVHQWSLPKSLPEVEGLSLAAHYQPARRMGGDSYMVAQVGRRLVLYLSDVSGHGLDGAMLTMFLKEAIGSYLTLRKHQVTPGDLLRHLCRQYRREDYSAEYFICIFLAVLDLETRELSYTGAGFQEFPLVETGDGRRLELTAPGLPITNAFPPGLLDIQEYRLTLTPGTTILFYTDGLTEQRVQAGDTGDEAGGGAPGKDVGGATDWDLYSHRLKKVFYQACRGTPEEIVQAINRDFMQFNQGSLQGEDDITYLVLKA